MAIFGGYRADRLIAEVRESGDPTSAKAKTALTRLQSLGQNAIQPIVDALSTSDKRETIAFVEALTPLIDNRSFPLIARALAEENPRAVAGVAWALASSRNYSPGLLLELLQNPAVSKPAVLDVIAAQRNRFNLRDLLNAAYAQDPNEKAALFRIAGELVDSDSVDELVSRVEGKDTIARTHIISLLARFDTPKVRSALQRTLKDPNKLVRAAALRAIQTGSGEIDPALIAPLLRDPEHDVRDPAIEILCRRKHADTVRHLVEVLKDENEDARRAAVEVLNVVGDESSVKYLLKAIRDSDWWVRSRAADALGKIGGPTVITAALELVSDKDEEIRRTAIEILNQTRDERALNYLIEATRDTDWWTSERAVDALGSMGNKKAVPRLLEMLKSDPKSMPSVVRALGKIGDAAATEGVLQSLDRSETDIRVEGMSALARLADDRSVDAVRAKILPFTTLADQTLAGAAAHALSELDSRFGGASITSGKHTLTQMAAAARADQQRTLLIESADVSAIMKQAETLQRLDIATLKPGDVIEGRYKYIERIGRGAFGTVLLMEDTVVDERLVLKFLNPNIANDEEMMQRFVHELRYSRKITHPNVIRIYDFLHIRGNYAISMEYFPSHTLGGEVLEGKPLAQRRAVRLGMDVAKGMSVAHAVGIVHRDLKPANVLINEEGVVKIVDFGVAAAQHQGDTQLTKTGYVIGSPKYMAPEQILGKKVDERADIYSLGVILYEMMTGSPPYHRGDHMSVMYQHVQGRARPPIELNPSLPQGISDLIMKCMAVDKEKRFASMDEVGVALERFL
ncbi:MAG TPA: HEAT repeat domain-containing protein [Steroidobacteraceae bacterium]|jgi:HEAT repeat protein/tRNA A-37 threonylcarbamoyl transferase component Bud32|nr:HEAT repeat domain-containing protein [Steroidobacteraceae bacterium]